MLSDIKSIFKHSSIYGFSTILQKGIGFLMIPVYTGFLSPSDYGILELMELTINIISMLIGMRLGTGIIRFYHEYKTEEERTEFFSTSLFFVLCITIILVTILQLFTEQFSGLILGEEKYYQYFQIIFISMGLQIIATVPESILLAEKKSVLFSAVTIFTLISYLTFNIIFLVIVKIGVLGILLSTLITKVLNTLSLLFIIRKKIKLYFSVNKLMQLVKYTLPLIPASFFMFAMHYADRFFIQEFCDLNELGLYSLGYKFGMMISVLVSQPFFRIWNTKQFELAKEKEAPIKMGLFFTYYSFVVILAALGISLFIDEVIILMTPSEYSQASSIVAAITIAYVLYGYATFFNMGMMITYKTKFLAYIQVSVALFNIVINYFLIQKMGVNGAVVSTFISFFLLSFITMAISQHLFSIKIEYLRVGILWGLYIILYACSQFIDLPFAYSLISKLILYVMFLFILYFFGFFSEIERLKLRDLLSSLIKRIKGAKIIKGN